MRALCTEFGTIGRSSPGGVEGLECRATCDDAALCLLCLQCATASPCAAAGPLQLTVYRTALQTFQPLLYTRRLYRRVVSDGYAYTDTNCEASTIYCTLYCVTTENRTLRVDFPDHTRVTRARQASGPKFFLLVRVSVEIIVTVSDGVSEIGCRAQKCLRILLLYSKNVKLVSGLKSPADFTKVQAVQADLKLS